jgi:hypothetical protein
MKDRRRRQGVQQVRAQFPGRRAAERWSTNETLNNEVECELIDSSDGPILAATALHDP